MNESELRKINITLEGSGNPTTTELIEVLKGVKQIVPDAMDDNFYINKVEDGSISITALIQPTIDLFMYNDVDVMFDVLGKVATIGGVYEILKGINNRLSANKKITITEEEVAELLEHINSDPNALRKVNKNDFKDFKKLCKIVKKRKNKVVFVDNENNKKIELTEESAEIIEAVANASEDDQEITEEKMLHLNISRVSFKGEERWKATILEEYKNVLIKIEDRLLYAKVNNNELSFSGKEVIQAMVRIETIKGKSNYFLTRYIDIVTTDDVEFRRNDQSE